MPPSAYSKDRWLGLTASVVWWDGLRAPIAWIVAGTLLAFAVVIARSLLQGERFSCCCFGDETAELSPGTLARSVMLAMLAIAAATADAAVTNEPFRVRLLEGLVALAVIGTAVMAVRLRQLWRWNSDPFGLHENLWTERSAR